MHFIDSFIVVPPSWKKETKASDVWLCLVRDWNKNSTTDWMPAARRSLGKAPLCYCVYIWQSYYYTFWTGQALDEQLLIKYSLPSYFPKLCEYMLQKMIRLYCMPFSLGCCEIYKMHAIHNNRKFKLCNFDNKKFLCCYTHHTMPIFCSNFAL